MTYSPLAQTLSITQTSTNPITLAGGGGNGSSVTITHPAVTNNELSLAVSKNVSGQSYTNTGINFSSAGNYVQQNSASGTQIAGGALTLFATTGSVTTQPSSAMTSDSAPSPFVAAASSEFSASYQAWMALTNNTGLAAGASPHPFTSYALQTAPCFLSLDVGTANAGPPYQYVVGCNTTYQSSSPSAWQFQASIDYVNWITLDTQSGQNVLGGVTYTLSGKAAAFRYFRLNVTAVYSAGLPGEVQIGLFQVKIVASTFPTGTMYYATTSTNSSMSLTPFTTSTITSVTFTSLNPANTTLVGLVSFDGRTTWKYWNGSAWTTTTLSNIATNGTALATITTALAGVTVASLPAQTALDFAWGLETTSSSATPAVFLVTIVIALPAAYQSASVGKLGSATQDIGMLRVSSTTTVLVNNTNAALQIQAALQVP